MSMYRQTFGLAAPIQLQMERMLVKNVFGVEIRILILNESRRNL